MKPPNIDMAIQRQQYRRISRTLHDQCLEAAETHKDTLTDKELSILTTVARGWSHGLSVTKEDHDAGRQILERLSAAR